MVRAFTKTIALMSGRGHARRRPKHRNTVSTSTRKYSTFRISDLWHQAVIRVLPEGASRSSRCGPECGGRGSAGARGDDWTVFCSTCQRTNRLDARSRSGEPAHDIQCNTKNERPAGPTLRIDTQRETEDAIIEDASETEGRNRDLVRADALSTFL